MYDQQKIELDAEPRLSIESFESLVAYGHLYHRLLELPSVLVRESQSLSTIKEGKKERPYKSKPSSTIVFFCSSHTFSK